MQFRVGCGLARPEISIRQRFAAKKGLSERQNATSGAPMTPLVTSPYDKGLEKNQANFTALTPLTFLTWAADVFPEHPSVIHGTRRFTWQETHTRCRRLASALIRRGIGVGDTVAAMLSNTPEM
jgi:non-ribosomal peptide synthetase component F